MTKLRMAVVGVGHHGLYHVDKLAQLAECEFVAVCDSNLQTSHDVAARFGVAAYQDYRELKGKVDAVCIVVPTPAHFPVAKFFLENNIHILVEKPICSTLEEADQLIALAKQHNCIFQVGHLERFNAVVIAAQHLIEKPLFIESCRVAPFMLRGTDVSVILDLMIHDLDIIQHMVNSPIKSIDASGAEVLSEHIDLINARIHFMNGCVANMTASRVSAQKQRSVRIFQHNAYLYLDLLNHRIDVYRKGTEFMLPGIPNITREEQTLTKQDALLAEIQSFMDAIQGKPSAGVSGEEGKRALKAALDITQCVIAANQQIAKNDL